MNVELFGVFGDRTAFDSLADSGVGEESFHRVIEGDAVTVGIRDDSLGLPGRTSMHSGSEGFAVVWGEAFPPDDSPGSAAEWLYEASQTEREGAFDGLNGSYVAVVELDGEPIVATDPVRSWECFTAETDVGRVFGTDAATVAGTIESPSIDPQGFAEFLYLGGALNTNTLLRELDRLSLDHALRPTGTRALARYRHEPHEFDYTAELATRLERAIRRRSNGTGTRGVLLSAGYDSRVLLECDPSIDASYTLGSRDSDEVAVAAQLAARYGVDHTTLAVDEHYLDRDASATRATNGVKESLHIHHAAYSDAISTDAISHGLLFDTLLRGYFLPWKTTEMLGLTIPHGRLDSDPDPVRHLAGILGYLPRTADLIHRTPGVDADSAAEFLENSIGAAFERCAEPARDEYAAFERFGVQNVLSTPFRTHLADRFRESHVAADAELVDWHLRTPPGVRTDETFRDALRRIDPDLLTPRPPDRPYDSQLVNLATIRLRNAVPGLRSFDTPWPDRRTTYEEAALDSLILPDRPDLHDYPPRFKLRVRDLRAWLENATEAAVSVDDYLPSAR